MAKVWSFNTTIRNPERMENMLRALTELEGVVFDDIGQQRFFGLQIQKRLYRPTRDKLEENELIDAVHNDTSPDDIEPQIVNRILDKYSADSVDASGRGRTAAGILNRFGLCVAQQSRGPVVITDLGKKWLAGDIDDEELFTKFFLKWQYPNFVETSGYGDFNIKPFVGVVSLIHRVNEKWEARGNKPVGLSKDEYRSFVPSLIRSSDIETYAEQILAFRSEKRAKSGKDKTDFIKQVMERRAIESFGGEKALSTALTDLRDYTDSSIRYFRMSGLIAIRGEGTHIDIAKDKKVEAKSINDTISPSAESFQSYEEYFKYLNNIEAPVLPWQTEESMQNIKGQLTGIAKEEAAEQSLDVTDDLLRAGSGSVTSQVSSLRALLNDIRIKKLKSLKHDTVKLQECIVKLESITSARYETLTARPSLDFEWYVSQALLVLNDAVDIHPSFKIGDDGIPTGFRANTSDIECYYKSFSMTVEVTLLLGRDQAYAEGQPVMRHLRDFETTQGEKLVYCIFVAPLIHRDTLNAFWMGNKLAYEGRRQHIIPLSLKQFIDVLKIAKRKIDLDDLDHQKLGLLLQAISQSVDTYKDSRDWIAALPSHIDDWDKAEEN